MQHDDAAYGRDSELAPLLRHQRAGSQALARWHVLQHQLPQVWCELVSHDGELLGLHHGVGGGRWQNNSGGVGSNSRMQSDFGD